eukprot:SAG31_NODE_89_length_26711_cov_24.949459_24_plen_79_part_00
MALKAGFVGNNGWLQGVLTLLAKLAMPTQATELDTGGGTVRRNIADTSCGFKLFSRGAACVLFQSQNMSRYMQASAGY